MGRLSIVTALSLGSMVALIIACNDTKKGGGAPIRRSDTVVASGTTPAKPSATATPSAKKPRVPRTVCTGAALNRDFPSQQVGHGEAPGAEVLGTTIRVGHGRWVWLNLWAAWCGPCKEELPLLFAWQKQLASSTDFLFLSFDDDQRQFLRFLQQQPAGGLRSSYWLPEGKTRAAWLKDLGIEPAPELPIQILINPKGKVACIIQGAVEEEDLPRVREIVSSR